MMPFFDLLQEILKSNNKKKGRQRLLERFFDLRKKKQIQRTDPTFGGKNLR